MKAFALALTLAAASGLTPLYAQKETDPRPPMPPPPPGAPFAHRSGREPREMEKVNFLGILTTPVSPTLTEQLGLQKDIGLVILSVVPDSPAAGVLKAHDIVTKINDQLLIETHQLAVLVRSFKENEEVSLTYIRGGKEATAKVKLVQREVPKDAWAKPRDNERAFSLGIASPDGNVMYRREMMDRDFENQAERLNQAREMADRAHEAADEARRSAQTNVEAVQEANRVLALIGADSGKNPRTVRSSGNGEDRVTIINTREGNVVYSDKDGTVQLNSDGGQKSLVVKNPKGETIFSGAATTADDRNALPAELRERLQKLETMNGLSFQTDSDFRPGEIRILAPNPRTISLPRGPRVPQADDDLAL